jgi:hypothetical protein|uniref:Uncharacterized protein n=1 Tax=uncultured marine virus TaxID=186617 RepID=A0A0F7L6F8_9VIRU|nr:hypothetical protein [uncultured marine virus]
MKIRKDITYEERGKIIDLASRPIYSNSQDIVLIGTDLDKDGINDMDALDVTELARNISDNLCLGKKKRSY